MDNVPQVRHHLRCATPYRANLWNYERYMDLIVKERDRLLQRTARVFGLSFTVVSFICLSLPGAVDLATYLICVPLYLVLGLLQFMMGRSRSLGWVAAAFFAGLSLIVLITTLRPDGPERVCKLRRLATRRRLTCRNRHRSHQRCRAPQLLLSPASSWSA